VKLVGKAFVFLMVFALVVGGGTYVYLWLRVRHNLGLVAESIAPFASLDYRWVSIGPMGTIGVHDLTLTPGMLGMFMAQGHAFESTMTSEGTLGLSTDDSSSKDSDPWLKVDRVLVDTPGLDYVLGGGFDELGRGELPERLAIGFRGVRVDRSLVSGLRGMVPVPGPANGLACNFASLIEGRDRAETPLPAEVVMDLELGVERRPNGAFMTAEIEERGHSRASFEATLIADARLPLTSQEPKLEGFAVSYALDPDFLAEAMRLCAQGSAMDVEAFTAALVDQGDNAYMDDLGLIPGPGLRQALVSALQGAEIRAEARPPSFLKPEYLTLYAPEQLPAILGLQVSVGGTPVEDLSFSIERPRGPAAAAAPESAPAPVRRSRPTGEIGFDQLAECLGCDVVISLKSGLTRSGIVDVVQPQVVHVKRLVHGGDVTVEIGRAEIRSIRILGSGR